MSDILNMMTGKRKAEKREAEERRAMEKEMEEEEKGKQILCQ